MILRRLRIANLRAFSRETEFEFRPGMNLIVGVNGMGKSTVLDALRVLLSRMLPGISSCRKDPQPFEDDDVTVGRDFLSVQLICTIGEQEYEFAVNRPLEKYAATPVEPEQVRDRGQSTGQYSDWLRRPDRRGICRRNGQPFAIYFSPKRSVLDRTIGTAGSAKGLAEAAYANALKARELQSRELGLWLSGTQSLADEGHSVLQSRWGTLNDTVSYFLETDCRLSASGPKSEAAICKDGITLTLGQLSDGERGVLALVLDLTRRLAGANPELADPARDSEAVVLIDELDLHLHPRWQRSIVGKLERTFPKCQFIATTHSPQIISEVQPDRLVWLSRQDSGVVAARKPQSYGLDTNWILDHLMESESSPSPTRAMIDEIEEALDRDDLDNAKSKLQELREAIHGDVDETVRLESSINTLEVLTDEVDS